MAYPSSPTPIIETIKSKNITKKRKEIPTESETLIPFPVGGKANNPKNENFDISASQQNSMPPPLLKTKNKKNTDLESDPSSAQTSSDNILSKDGEIQKETQQINMEMNLLKDKDMIVKSHPTKNASLNTSVSVSKKLFRVYEFPISSSFIFFAINFMHIAFFIDFFYQKLYNF